ncbi:MAG: FAD-dependent oxidoreductase [Archangium sp.]
MNDLWPYAEVPGMPHVYVCGCFERWVSIHLQEIRGLNLAWALAKERGVKRVTVVGGGFAGLACAAGLSRLGVKVTLIERANELLATQRNNHVRFIHPHIHHWPREGCLSTVAELPMLGWNAGLSSAMAKEVLDGFEAEAKNIDVQLGVKSVDLAQHETVVLALGVGIEKTFGSLPLRSYWADEDIAVEHHGFVRHHLVTGLGEGGVIDTLYLRLKSFSHQRFAETFATIPGMKEVERKLLEFEDEIASLDDVAANERIFNFSNALDVPREVDDFMSANLRTDTRVTLNGPEKFPLAARADIFNRFLISRLLALNAIQYVPGKITAVEEDGIGWIATLESGATLGCDEVNVRHGTVPSLKTAFPEVWERYAPVRAKLPHLVPGPQWPADAFSYGARP